MLQDLFRRLFGGTPSAAHSTETDKPKVEPDAPRQPDSPASRGIPKATSQDSSREQSTASIPKSHRTKLPIDLDIGLDLGTSCTKAVIGDREANRQTAVPLNRGADLRGYLLPTRVHLEGETYSLTSSERSIEKRGLKMRILESAAKGNVDDEDALCDLTAFAALVIRRILDWYGHDLSRDHPNRDPVWHLNIGLPSPGGANDQFAPLYRRLIRAAASLVPGNAAIERDQVLQLVRSNAADAPWLPESRLNTFPEAGAQLASLVLSPHRPSGCLLVVDVGAGTMDISTLRIGGNATSARCTLHICKVAPLGVHYLFLARHGIQPGASLTTDILSKIPHDDGLNVVSRKGLPGSPLEFVARCRESILPVVAQYRRRLKDAHQSKAFRPWVDGLPYVLSGGGHRDPFYQEILKTRLEQWLETVVSEWSDGQSAGRRRRLVHQSFPVPRSFAPKVLLSDFDRFSVAHGLALGPDGLMEMRNASE